MSDVSPLTGSLPVAFATWVYALADAGHAPADPAIAAAVSALADAGPDADADALGKSLVDAVAVRLAGATTVDAVAAVARALFGAAAISTDFGADRAARLRTARAYPFQTSLPWIACLIARFPDGTVGPNWLLVERVTDVALCMDPYPWDDLDEEHTIELTEFLVKWELAGGQGLRWLPA